MSAGARSAEAGQRRPQRLGVVLGVLIALAGVSAPGAASAAESNASVSLSTHTAAPGEVIIVELTNWPSTVATLMVCGNSGSRGSPDCDLLGAQSLSVREGPPRKYDFRGGVPPVNCPCVVRAASRGDTLVRTAPVDIDGVPEGPPIADVGVDVPDLHVDATVSDSASSLHAFAAALGAPAHRTLDIAVSNRGSASLAHVTIEVVVGRGASEGAVVERRTMHALDAGERRTLAIPLTLQAPAFGTYVVHGTVGTAAATVPFEAGTSNDPWALEVAVVLGVLALAMIARRRERRAQADAASARLSATATRPVPVPGNGAAKGGAPSKPMGAAAPTSAAQACRAPLPAVPENSPEVGGAYGVRCEVPSYSHADPGHRLAQAPNEVLVAVHAAHLPEGGDHRA